MALGGANPKQDKPRRLQLGPLLISHSQQMRSCKSTARCFSFIYWCYKTIFNSTFDPPASLCIGRSASLMFTEAAAGRWIISAGQLFSALCHAGAGQPAKPSPCHLLHLLHEVPGCSGGHRAPGCCCRRPRAGAGQEGTGFRHLVGSFRVPSSGRASILAVSQENCKIIKEIGKISKGEVFEMSCSVGQHHKHKRRGKMKGGFFIILVLSFFCSNKGIFQSTGVCF